MKSRRTDRLNSLLKEVISEVITRDVKDPRITTLTSITSVDISKDLQHAKVYISVIGTEEDKQKTLLALQQAAGFVAIVASKKVVMRYFPALTFKLDRAVDKHLHIEALLEKIHLEKKSRPSPPEDCESTHKSCDD